MLYKKTPTICIEIHTISAVISHRPSTSADSCRHIKIGW